MIVHFDTSKGSYLSISVPENYNPLKLHLLVKDIPESVLPFGSEIIGLTSSILKSEELAKQVVGDDYTSPACVVAKQVFLYRDIFTEALIIKKK